MAIHRPYGELAASLVRGITDCRAPGAASARAGVNAALRGNEIDVVKALAARWVDGVWLPDTADEAPWWRQSVMKQGDW